MNLHRAKTLWRRYVTALVIVLVLLGVSHTASRMALHGSDEATHVISIAGHQHMLSQKILYFAALARRGDFDPRLREAIDEFETSHRALSRGGTRGLSVEGAAERAPAYFSAVDGLTLDWLTRRFIDDARRVAEDDADAAQSWRRMEMIGPALLLERLSGAVEAFEGRAQRRTERVETIADLSFLLAILTVAAEAALIFLPAQRSVTSAISQLETAREHADALRETAVADRAVAERARKAQTRFLSYISHELRTPLNGVIGMLTLMGDDPPRDELRAHVRVARSASDQLLSIVSDVLDLSRLEAGGMQIARVAFDMRETAEASLAILAPRARQKGIALEAAIEPDLPPALLGDPGRIQQILTNLLGNAITYTDRGGVSLRVAYDRAAEELRIRVEDTGAGIAERDRLRLFEPFRQTEQVDPRQQTGSGLGLSICKELVDLMGGRIFVESEVDRGSVFGFDLPLPVSQAPVRKLPRAPRIESAARAGASRSSRGARHSVLVVDDNAVNRMVAMRFVEGAGHRACCAADGAEAVEMARIGAFDVILMDINMPVIDGFEATRRIRALDGPAAHIPIIAATADATTEDRQRILAAGLDGYLSKPIRRAELLSAIARVVATATGQDRNRPPAA